MPVPIRILVVASSRKEFFFWERCRWAKTNYTVGGGGSVLTSDLGTEYHLRVVTRREDLEMMHGNRYNDFIDLGIGQELYEVLVGMMRWMHA